MNSLIHKSPERPMSSNSELDSKALAHELGVEFCWRRPAWHHPEQMPIPCGPCCADAERFLAAALPAPAVPVATEPVARDAELWRWFRERAWVGTTEDGEVCMSALCGEPADVECFTDAERELFENDSPDVKDMPSLCQRIAEWHSDVPAALPAPRPREEGT